MSLLYQSKVVENRLLNADKSKPKSRVSDFSHVKLEDTGWGVVR